MSPNLPIANATESYISFSDGPKINDAHKSGKHMHQRSLSLWVLVERIARWFLVKLHTKHATEMKSLPVWEQRNCTASQSPLIWWQSLEMWRRRSKAMGRWAYSLVFYASLAAATISCPAIWQDMLVWMNVISHSCKWILALMNRSHWMWGIFCGVMSVPHNIVMDLNNVMTILGIFPC